MVQDRISWHAEFECGKFRDPDGVVAAASKAGANAQELAAMFPERHIATERWEKNVALHEGLDQVIDLITGIASPTKWDASNARVEVGTSNTAPADTQTGLLGTKAYAVMDGTYPQKSSQIAKWKGTFASGTAEFAWEEYSVCNSGDDSTGINLNRCTASKGTKSSGETWTLEIDITFG